MFPNGGETYEIFLSEAAAIAAKNMKIATKCENNWINYQFRNIFNIDRGSQSNCDTIRNAMVYLIKKELEIPQFVTQYENKKTGILYDFTEYYVMVTQELFHLVIRCRDAKIMNFNHSDYFAVIRGLTKYSKQLQFKYDIKTSPAFLTNKIFDPRKAIKQIKILQNEDALSMIKKLILCFLRLQKTYSNRLKFELLQYIKTCPLRIVSKPQLKAKQIVSNIINKLIDSVPKKHFGQVISV